MNKILSIIIPTYNMEKYLRKCLDSFKVSSENMERLEVLVINDGSKDSSLKIAQEYQNLYPQVFRVVDKDNGNYGSCINRGLKEASGKYVKVLDADDYFDSSVLDKYIDFLMSQEVDMVMTDFAYVNEEGEIMSRYTFDIPEKESIHLYNLPEELIPHLAHFIITYRRSMFSKFDYKQSEGVSYSDDEWVFKPMMWIDNIVYYPSTLYLYLRGREGQTFDPKVLKKSLDNRIFVAKEMISFYVKNVSKCLPSNKLYVTKRLSRRVQDLYSTYLINYYSRNNNRQVADFDSFLKQVSPDIYESFNKLNNKYGWYYIRQWRMLKHSYFSPELVLIRIKRRFQRIFKNNNILIDFLPSDLARKKNI